MAQNIAKNFITFQSITCVITFCVFDLEYLRYFQAGGNPGEVIRLLSTNYLAYAQMGNLMAEWIILAGS